MSFTAASSADIVRDVNGVTYRFKRPTRDQVGQQIATWAAADAAKLKALLKEAGVSPETVFTVLAQHDRDSRLIQYGLRCAMEFTRSGDIAAAASGLKASELPFTPDEIVDLALELWGFEIPKKADETKDGKPEKDGARPLDGSEGDLTGNTTGSSVTH